MGRSAIFGERKVPRYVLTAKQVEVLTFLVRFYEENDQIPPCRVIAEHFNFASDNAANDHLQALARRGWIEKNSVGRWKFSAKARREMAEAVPA